MTQLVSSSTLPSSHIWTRVMAAIDRALLNSANLARRNGDMPYFGL